MKHSRTRPYQLWQKLAAALLGILCLLAVVMGLLYAVLQRHPEYLPVVQEAEVVEYHPEYGSVLAIKDGSLFTFTWPEGQAVPEECTVSGAEIVLIAGNNELYSFPSVLPYVYWVRYKSSRPDFVSLYLPGLLEQFPAEVEADTLSAALDALHAPDLTAGEKRALHYLLECRWP